MLMYAFHRETNLLGGVATGNLYGQGNGLVHRGFYNLIHTTPDGVQDDNPAKVQARYGHYSQQWPGLQVGDALG